MVEYNDPTLIQVMVSYLSGIWGHQAIALTNVNFRGLIQYKDAISTV